MVTIKGGCVLINIEERKVAIIYRKRLEDYSFPKGHMEEGETVKECAIRETIEETGRKVELLKEEPIYIDRYVTSLHGENVECYFYLAKDCGEYKGEIAETDKEVCEWYDINKVENILTYDDTKELWKAVKSDVLSYLE